MTIKELTKEQDIIRRFKIILIDDEDEDDIFPITNERIQQLLDTLNEEKGKIKDYIIKSIGLHDKPKDDEEIQKEYGLSNAMFQEFKTKVFIRLNTAPKMSILTGRQFPVDYTQRQV